jgi:hypothetical protein
MHAAPSNTPSALEKRAPASSYFRDLLILICIALATIVVHQIVGNRYGFQRDELATMDDARHLAWGYVAYPPVTPFFGRISLALFGTSIRGLRLFANIAMAIAVVLTGLMARDLGGRRGAQLIAAVATVPFCLAGGQLMQYVAFDYLAWVLAAYFIVRLLKSGDPRWWVAIGAAIGFGMLSKYTMAFFAVSIAAAVVLTDARRYLKSKWLWIGLAMSLLIFLPNFLWQVHNHFISLDMLKHIHARDIRIGRTKNFLPEQLEITLFGSLLALAGLYFYFFSPEGKRFRMLGWTYVVVLLLFSVGKGRSYYMGPAYPMLYAAGAAWGERWLATMSRGKAMTVRCLAWIALAVDIVLVSAFFLPLAPLGTRWWNVAAGLQGDHKEEVGWPELVQEVAKIRDSLSPAEREHLAILGTNYGEAGAINLYGPQYGLPQAISGVNSFWVRGYGNPEPQAVIVLGLDLDYLDDHFQGCRLAGHTWNPYGIVNEETGDHPNIFVCGPPKAGWLEFWQHFRYFG